MGKKSSKRQSRCGVMHLDAETSLAPVPPLRVVAAERILLAKEMISLPPFAPVGGRADNPS